MYPRQSKRTRYTIKQILTTNDNWWRFHAKYKHKMRDGIIIAIVKLLSCKNIVRGYKEYHCSNIACSHVKYVFLTCKSKACSSCGKKEIERWLSKQMGVLPDTTWQHITFTMPDILWDLFWCNRELLNSIGKISANCVKKLAKNKKCFPGIFIAIHTFGRQLNRHVHIHLSVTLGGLNKNHTTWKKLYFDQKTLMKMWRYQIIKLFRQTAKKGLRLSKTIKDRLSPHFSFNHLLDQLYQKTWVVNCAKPENRYKRIMEYFSRYVKRPPIAESKLRHYDGHEVTFRYLDHKTKTYKNKTLPNESFIRLFIQHIPDVGFRMIRYYGFLANRIRGKLLPIVHRLLGQTDKPKMTTPTYAQLMKKNFNVDPLLCPFCGQPLQLTGIKFGKTAVKQLLPYHQQLALLQKI